MVWYLDSSAVVKRYAPERGSVWIKSLFDRAVGDVIAVGHITIVEVAAALRRKVRIEELSHDEYETTLELFLTDVARGDYGLVVITDEVIIWAVELTKGHPLRAYDAIQLAMAMVTNRALIDRGMLGLAFVSADTALLEAAEAEGLAIENPNEH